MKISKTNFMLKLPNLTRTGFITWPFAVGHVGRWHLNGGPRWSCANKKPENVAPNAGAIIHIVDKLIWKSEVRDHQGSFHIMAGMMTMEVTFPPQTHLCEASHEWSSSSSSPWTTTFLHLHRQLAGRSVFLRMGSLGQLEDVLKCNAWVGIENLFTCFFKDIRANFVLAMRCFDVIQVTMKLQ